MNRSRSILLALLLLLVMPVRALAQAGNSDVNIGANNPLGISGFANGDLIYFNNGVFNRLPIGSVGQVVGYNAGLPGWVAAGGGTGLTSVGLQWDNVLYPTAFPNSPLVANGTLGPPVLKSQSANTIFSNATGAPAAPAFNALSVTAGTGLTGGGNICTSPTISLSTPVSVANGGTGVATAAAQSIFCNTSGSPAAPGFTSLSVTVGTGLSETGSGILTNNPVISLSTPVSIANGGTGAATVAADTIFCNNTVGTAAPAFNTLNLTAGTGLTGGGNLATSPTVALATPVAIANGGTGAATVSSNTIFGNNTGSSAAPAFSSVSSYLDTFGSAQGDVLYRGASGWSALAPGTNGQFLQTQGASANPQWAGVNQIAVNGGRLYGVTGSPFADTTSSGTTIVYFGPAYSNQIFINGTWQTFSEASLTISGLSAGMYDINAVSASSSTITLSSTAWTNSTTPPARDQVNGVWVPHLDHTKIIVGSINVSGSGTNKTYDYIARREISGVYNQISKQIQQLVDAGSATGTAGTWAPDGNGVITVGTNTVNVASWTAQGTTNLTYFALLQNATASGVTYIGIGINSGSVPTVNASYQAYTINSTGTTSCSYSNPNPAGLTQYVMIDQQAGGNGTIYSSANGQMVGSVFN